MASEILGLFGGKSPQQLQQDYLSNLSVSPGQMGSQGLLQQLISTGANAGTMMGYGAGRLLGGKVAGEVEASYLNEAIQAGQAGKTPAEKMKLVAAALEDKPGMGRQYMLALQEARKLEAEDFTMASAKEKARTRTIKRQVDQFDPYTGKVIGQRSADITQVDSGKRDDKGNIIWEDLQQQDRTTQTPPAAGGSTGNAFDAEAERRAKEKEGKPQGGATTPESVNDFVGASTNNIDMAALEKQAQADRANAAYEAEAKEISSLDQLTPAVIAGLTRQQAIAAFRKYKKNLTKEQTDAILAKAGARRTQFR